MKSKHRVSVNGSKSLQQVYHQQPSRGRRGGAVMNTEPRSHVTLSASSKRLTDTDKG